MFFFFRTKFMWKYDLNWKSTWFNRRITNFSHLMGITLTFIQTHTWLKWSLSRAIECIIIIVLFSFTIHLNFFFYYLTKSNHILSQRFQQIFMFLIQNQINHLYLHTYVHVHRYTQKKRDNIIKSSRGYIGWWSK